MPEFTPVQVVDRSKEKEWPHKLGIMDWDDTRIVFTKRQLIDFLKYTGVTIDTNFSQIAKLPRYAEFGTISGDLSSVEPVALETSAAAPPTESVSSNPGDPTWKPTRRVHEPSRAAAPPARAAPAPAAKPASPEPQAPRVVDNDGNAFIPTRRVRTAPGGKDSIGAFLAGE
ncbi:unnamed protein product [Rhizoctonia solani]|uniref:Uncharacterized protein n=1 Tax=Rhizoctonia solani TaxID=456999 RepID=A0A8H3HW24_9AGAM|nr:unnamed protein product [Rhizoctonia solani]